MSLSIAGALLSVAILAPSLLLVVRPPRDARPLPGAGIVATVLERAGQAACLVAPALTATASPLNPWLAPVAAGVAAYLALWARYAASPELSRLYGPVAGIPIPLALLPVATFGLAAAWLASPWVAGAAALLAAGHLPTSWAAARGLAAEGAAGPADRMGGATGAMRLGYSAAQLRAAEAPLLAAGEPLMLRAAAGLASELRALLAGRAEPRALVLAGSGDNGGDALHAAAELAAAGVAVDVVPAGSRLHEEGAAAARAAGARFPPAERAAELAAAADVVVDGILGIGAAASPALRGTARELVRAVLPALAREPRPLVVAVDLPSGIGPDDGAVPDPGAVLPADVTVTFGAEKAGLLLSPGAELAGRVVLVDLGLGPGLAEVEPLVRRTTTG